MPRSHRQKIHQPSQLENGSYDQNVKHLEREMELNVLEADEALVKAQMTLSKKEQNTIKPNKKKMTKPKNKLRKPYPTKHSKMINVVVAKMPAT